MAKDDDTKNLHALVRDILENCPGENAGQFLADRISIAWNLGYKAAKRDVKSNKP